MTLEDSQYYLAAAADIAMEGLDVSAVILAEEVSDSAEAFFWAIQAAIRLKELCE